MTIHESAEDYLEQILMVMERKGHVRSIDIAAGLKVTKASVSVAMRKLRENGFINMGSDNLISLTDKGYAIARKIYDRHRTLTKYLIQLGVSEKNVKEDACKIEHHLRYQPLVRLMFAGRHRFGRVLHNGIENDI